MVRTIEFVGQSREDPRAFPATIRQDIGHALYQVQRGKTPDAVKPLRGFGSAAFEIRKTGEGGTYRTVYTVALPSAI
jgi:phage-related protein